LIAILCEPLEPDGTVSVPLPSCVPLVVLVADEKIATVTVEPAQPEPLQTNWNVYCPLSVAVERLYVLPEAVAKQ
jgi:hypothetical protein